MKNMARCLARIGLLVTVIAMTSGSASAQVGCPVSCGFGDQCTTDPVKYFYHFASHGTRSGDASMNLPQGALFAAQGYVNTDDLFTVDSTPNAMPLALHLDVEMSCGGSNGSGYFQVVVPGKGQATDQAYLPQPGPPDFLPSSFDKHYLLVLNVTQGESFHLQAQFGAGGGSGANYGNASGGLSYRFIDLVPGVRLHSCHGLRVDSATPAIAATWGALKAHYR